MKHYPHHIGDFDKATRHLNRIERSVYRDLIDLYYDTEQRLTLDKAALCRRIIARTNEEVTAVEQVLNEFFTETPTGWYHDRCEAEIAAYHSNTSQKAMAGKASAEAKRLKKLQALNGSATHVEQPLNPVEAEAQRNSTNQSTNQPINQQPKEEAPRKRSAPAVKPMATVEELVQAGFPPDTAAEFIAHKAGMKAPLTERAWRDHLAEAEKAGWTPLQAAEKVMAKSWKGFEAKYVIGERPPVASRQSFADHDEQKRRARWEEMTGRKWPTSGDVIDAEITQPRIAA
jgi:uncharacterized protein YdaU (DUF1376 family)